jgi:hypothetical protein
MVSFGLLSLREVHHLAQSWVTFKQVVQSDEARPAVHWVTVSAEHHQVAVLYRDQQHGPARFKHVRAYERRALGLSHFSHTTIGSGGTLPNKALQTDEPQRLRGPLEAPKFQCQTLPKVDWNALWLAAERRSVGQRGSTLTRIHEKVGASSSQTSERMFPMSEMRGNARAGAALAAVILLLAQAGLAATPPRLVELECPKCQAKHWEIDHDYRTIAGYSEPYEQRTYDCSNCRYAGTGFRVLQKSPPGFLINSSLHNVTGSELVYWLGVLRKNFPDHPRLKEVELRGD